MDKEDKNETSDAGGTAPEIKDYSEEAEDVEGTAPEITDLSEKADDVEGAALEIKEYSEEANDVEGSALEIKEYSEASFNENDDDDGAGESKESGSQNEASESIEEAPDYIESRSPADEEHDRDIAQQKKNRRARAQPGAKRGGRRDTGRSTWGARFRMKKKAQFQAGDLVEAEWGESGWWYVGYVGGGDNPDGAAEVKAGKRNKKVYHIIFIDGDEANVAGKDLKLLGTTGAPGENRDTALPRHVTVADLGSGRLHGGREPPDRQRRKTEREGKGKRHQSEKNDGRNKNNATDDGEDKDKDSHKTPETEGTLHSPLPRRVSVGNVEDRVKLGKTAVWGGRGAPDAAIRGGGSGGGGGGDWWDTGTPYALQPRLTADKTTVLSFVSAGGRQVRDAGVDQRVGVRGNGGGSDDDSHAVSRTDSVASGLSLQHNQQTRGARSASRELMRIVKVPESNEHHGQRVFFLA
eukprot:g9157.t1